MEFAIKIFVLAGYYTLMIFLVGLFFEIMHSRGMDVEKRFLRWIPLANSVFLMFLAIKLVKDGKKEEQEKMVENQNQTVIDKMNQLFYLVVDSNFEIEETNDANQEEMYLFFSSLGQSKAKKNKNLEDFMYADKQIEKENNTLTSEDLHRIWNAKKELEKRKNDPHYGWILQQSEETFDKMVYVMKEAKKISVEMEPEISKQAFQILENFAQRVEKHRNILEEHSTREKEHKLKELKQIVGQEVEFQNNLDLKKIEA